MSEKRIGTLIYDPSMGRFDIRFGIESYYGGLHCGECFDVKVRMHGFRFGLKWTRTGILWDFRRHASAG